jgi:hypothetical protein
MTDQSAQEPTMEEILASIRRIISEDDAPAAQPAAESAAEPEPVAEPAAAAPMAQAQADEPDEVLELTQRYEDSTPEPVHSVGDIDALAADPAPAAASESPAYQPPAYEPPAYEAPRVHSEPEGLLSARAEDSAASAFGQLAGALLMPRDGRTLEDVVRELLRPMLKEWLDANLPSIVEAQVRAEVERVARRGAR